MEVEGQVFAPGARVVVRDAEWLVRRVDRSSTGEQVLRVVGISEIVRDKEAIFLTEVEPTIDVLDPARTALVQDTSPGYRASRLYMESLLRRTPPTDNPTDIRLYVGNRAAMDTVPYQLQPALEALEQPRQRILIADGVGLGKTLEAGILISELIRRGRGKRILVVAVKSMLTQFQKEMWSRFTIPLVRLDSVGIQRIRSEIPTNHNPFHVYDRAIISIDTLKRDSEYRTYLENAWWDIIVIDEAHNVAERGRGASRSQRARLAALLSDRSDTLIMLSATPHDGSARSFASLMNMLDPTAIADPDHYTRDDIRGLCIRRFKKDIHGQVENAFKDRTIRVVTCEASPAEEHAFDTLVDLNFTRLDQRRTAGQLFKTTLEKSLFSSPAACLQTVRNRVGRLKKEDGDFRDDIRQLEALRKLVEAIGPGEFSRYQHLLHVIRDARDGFGWDGTDPKDRLVIFTERIETLKFLQQHLQEDLGLRPNQVAILHGTMSDVEQQSVVEEFGKDEAPVRLLIASDVASEGINLHYLCHRLIHFDIPWSLMVFQQRNGRIDRYGQERNPEIVYLRTDSANRKIRGDTRILEILVKKDEQAHRNIGDPRTVMGVYDIEEEENITGKAIEQGQSAEEFEQDLDERARDTFDPLAVLLGEAPAGERAPERTASMPSLFPSDYAYLKTALDHLRPTLRCDVEYDEDAQRIDLSVPQEVKQRFRQMPKEVRDRDGRIVLSPDREAIDREIRRCREDEVAWPTIHYLWEQHLVLKWINDKVLAAFGRHEAPVLELPGRLNEGEVVFVLASLIPNRKSHPLVHRWFGVVFRKEGLNSASREEGGHPPSGGQPCRLYPGLRDASDTDALHPGGSGDASGEASQAPPSNPQADPGGATVPVLSGVEGRARDTFSFVRIEPLEDLMERARLGRDTIPNPGREIGTAPLDALLPEAVVKGREWMHDRRLEFEAEINPKLEEQMRRLEALKQRHVERLELELRESSLAERTATERRQKRQREIDHEFSEFLTWIEDTMTTEDQPYLQVVAALAG